MEATVRAKPTTNPAATRADHAADDAAELVEEELLVEEISIDGMCGVY
jgi:mycofactocin precursor